MSSKVEFSRTQKLLTALADVCVFIGGMYLSFYLRFGFTIPARNLNDAKAAMVTGIIAFLLVNALSGMYVLYNKTLLDIAVITVVDQALVTILIMALTFVGRWFAFPRSVLLINFAVSTVLLGLWRLLEFKTYQKLRGVKRVMIVGPAEELNRSVVNFLSNRSSRHRLTHVVDGSLSLIHI